jgi:hypothetical protein
MPVYSTSLSTFPPCEMDVVRVIYDSSLHIPRVYPGNASTSRWDLPFGMSHTDGRSAVLLWRLDQRDTVLSLATTVANTRSVSNFANTSYYNLICKEV